MFLENLRFRGQKNNLLISFLQKLLIQNNLNASKLWLRFLDLDSEAPEPLRLLVFDNNNGGIRCKFDRAIGVKRSWWVEIHRTGRVDASVFATAAAWLCLASSWMEIERTFKMWSRCYCLFCNSLLVRDPRSFRWTDRYEEPFYPRKSIRRRFERLGRKNTRSPIDPCLLVISPKLFGCLAFPFLFGCQAQAAEDLSRNFQVFTLLSGTVSDKWPSIRNWTRQLDNDSGSERWYLFLLLDNFVWIGTVDDSICSM